MSTQSGGTELTLTNKIGWALALSLVGVILLGSMIGPVVSPLPSPAVKSPAVAQKSATVTQGADPARNACADMFGRMCVTGQEAEAAGYWWGYRLQHPDGDDGFKDTIRVCYAAYGRMCNGTWEALEAGFSDGFDK